MGLNIIKELWGDEEEENGVTYLEVG